jgi:hypothetical protein
MQPVTHSTARNRRAALRRPPRQSIHFECRKGAHGLGPNYALAANNISETGMSILLKVKVATGDEVEVTIDGYGMRAAKRNGTVVWAHAEGENLYMAGIRFHKPLPFNELQRMVKPE